VDDFQQRHRWLAFPFAVVKKFGDDQAGRHAALLAYYGFFSLFPLLLVAVTMIGFILQGRSDLANRIVDSTAAQFPIVGTSIAKTVEGSHLRGSGLALVVGAAFALWGGLGVADAAQAAMNGIWNVPVAATPASSCAGCAAWPGWPCSAGGCWRPAWPPGSPTPPGARGRGSPGRSPRRW